MRNLLLFVAALCSSVHVASAQKIRFTDTANRWKIESSVGIMGESCQELALMKMGADTLIKGLVYKKPEILFYSYHCDGQQYTKTASAKITGGYYREDTALGRVYCRSIWPGDSVERVIYDADWRIGDTLAWGSAGHGSGKSIVVGFDSAFINNVWHKVFRMGYLPQSGYPAYYIVEGIGCTNGPGFPIHANPPFENYDRLKCFMQGGSQPRFTLASGRTIPFNNTTSCTLGVQDGTVIPGSVQVVPNPGGSQVALHIAPTIKSGSVQLMDVAGRIIGSFDFRENNIIPIGPYFSAPGMYHYRLQDAATGQQYTGRFIYR